MATSIAEIPVMAEPQKKTTTKNKKKTTPVKTTKSTGKTSGKTSTKSGAKTSANTAPKPTTSAEAKKIQAATQQEIKLTEEQIKENERSVKNGLNELGKLEGDIAESGKKIDDLNKKIADLSGQINGLESNISSNEAELERLRSEYLKAVKKMRVAKKSNSELAFVFSSDNFNQAVRRMRYLKEFSQWKDKQSSAINEKINVLETEKSELARAKDTQSRALTAQQAEQKKQEAQYERQSALVAELKQNGEALKSHLSKKQAEANMLKNQISSLIAEEQRKEAEEQRKKEEARKAEQQRLAQEEKARAEAEEARLLAEAESARKSEVNTSTSKKSVEITSSATKESKNKEITKKEDKKTKEATKKEEKSNQKTGAPANYADARKRSPRSKNANETTSTTTSTPGKSFSEMKGSLPLPASGSFKVTSRFGPQALPDLPDVVYDNPGIDAEVAAGATALAVYDGNVSGIYMIPGYQTVIIVNHGGYYTVYGNISSPSVKVGDSVKAGQGVGAIAKDEDDPSHSSIHFEVWRNREKLNPLDWIRI